VDVTPIERTTCVLGSVANEDGQIGMQSAKELFEMVGAGFEVV
jgi:hypothetical protein